MQDAVLQTPFSLNARQGFALSAAFAAMLIVCLAVPRALSFLPGLYGIVGFVYIRVVTKKWPRFDFTLLGFFAALSALGGLSALWSVDPGYSFERALKVGGTLLSLSATLAVICTIPFGTSHKDKIAALLCLACGVAGFLIFSEYQTSFAISRYFLHTDPNDIPRSMKNGFLLNRSLVNLSLLCLPSLLALYGCGLSRKIKLACLAFLLCGVGLALAYTQSQTAVFAMALAALMMLFPANRKIARRALTVLVVAGIFAAPLLPGPIFARFFKDPALQENDVMKEASIPNRFEVWDFVSSKIKEKPLLGYGMDATRFLKSDRRLYWMRADHVMHPHNAILEMWIEMGVFGAVLTAAFAVFLLRRIGRLPPVLQRYYTMLFVVVLGMLCMAYGLWQAWQLGMIAAISAYSVMAANLYSLNERPRNAC